MNITCCICHDIFVPSDDVYFTPCGHFFHFPCVTHWLERSKSCPHCRTKVTDKKIHRAYFDFASTPDAGVDSTMLISKIDSLNFQILMKDKDLKICGEDNATLKKQTSGLRAEVKKLEIEIDKHKSAIYAFKEQAKILKQANSDYDIAKQELVRLKRKLEDYKNIQKLLSDSQDVVECMLREAHDPVALVTYISVMKREMEINVQKRKELRDRIKKLERETLVIKSERDALLQEHKKCSQLRNDLAHSENENKSLFKKLRILQCQISSEKKTSSDDVQRFVTESPAPERIKVLKEDTATVNISDSDTTSVNASTDLENEIQSPDPPLKIGSRRYSLKGSVRLRSPISGLSILAKKPRLTTLSKPGNEIIDVHYDGFGGHSKVDQFPSPTFNFKPKVLKMKRRKPTDENNKKLDTFFGVVDLT